MLCSRHRRTLVRRLPGMSVGCMAPTLALVSQPAPISSYVWPTSSRCIYVITTSNHVLSRLRPSGGLLRCHSRGGSWTVSLTHSVVPKASRRMQQNMAWNRSSLHSVSLLLAKAPLSSQVSAKNCSCIAVSKLEAGKLSPAISLCVVLNLCLGISLFDGGSLASAAIFTASSEHGISKEIGAKLVSSLGSNAEKRIYQHVSSAPLQAAPIFSLARAEGMCECEESYGILPCSKTVGGNLFLILVYGYLLLTAAKFLSEGSELLLEVMNPGLLGGLLLPMLGALPDALLILVSGNGGTIEEAQQEVLVGVGVLAGSTVMILTVAWAGSIFVGRCDLSGPNGTAKDLTLSKSFDLYATGVTTDEQTRWGAWIMMASVLPYLVVQIPLLDGQASQGPLAALAGCALSIVGLLVYCGYQVASPWLQQKRIEEARLQFLRSRALQGVSAFSADFKSFSSKILAEGQEGHPTGQVVRKLFRSFDKNQDGKIEAEELRGLILGLELDEVGYILADEQVETWLKEFDINADGMLSEAEFEAGLSRWAQRVAEEKRTRKVQMLESSVGTVESSFWAAKTEEAKRALDLLESEVSTANSSNDTEEMGDGDAAKIYKKAVIFMAAGAALAAVFADPMVDTIGNFSTASGIPAFYVAFVVTPFASNASELFSSFLFAMKRRKRNISLTFSQVYGAVTMNNTLCLGLFLGLVYARGLTWDFSSEVCVIIFSILLVGAIAGSRSTFPLWWGIPVLALYPFSIAGVAVLDNVLGWR